MLGYFPVLIFLLISKLAASVQLEDPACQDLMLRIIIMNVIGIAYNTTYVLYLLVMLSNREHAFTFGLTFTLITLGFREHHTCMQCVTYIQDFGLNEVILLKITNLQWGQLTNYPIRKPISQTRRMLTMKHSHNMKSQRFLKNSLTLIFSI